MKVSSAAPASWKTDAMLVAAAWAAVRAPLLWLRMPPMVQVDSFCYLTSDGNSIHSPPIYGMFLRLLQSPAAAVLAQHLLALAAALIWAAVGRAAVNRLAGLLAGLAAASYGCFAVWGHVLMAETLFNFFIALHVGALYLAIRTQRRSGSWFFAAGVAAGAAAGVRAVAQWQAAAVALALAPHYLSRDGWKRYATNVVALVGGFAVVAAPVVARVHRLSGEFGMSTGLAPVLMYRLVYDRSAPLADVPVADPKLAAIRDYLVEATRTDFDVLWVPAYEHIERDLAPPGENSEEAVNKAVSDLWRLYVARYPWRYLRFSLNCMYDNLHGQPELTGNQEFSARVIANVLAVSEGGRDRPFVQEIVRYPPPSAERLSRWSAFYRDLARLQFNPALVILTLSLGVWFLIWSRAARGAGTAFWLAVYATMANLYVPQYFVNIVILRYRFPLDLLFFLAAGAVWANVIQLGRNQWARRRTDFAAPRGGI